MITSEAWRGKRYAVLGLARSGRATVAALMAGGAEVVAWDGSEAARNLILPGTGRGTGEAGGGGSPQAAALRAESPLHHPADGPPPRAGEDLRIADPLTLDLTGFAGVVVSPGVPLNRHPIAAHAAQYGVPVIGDIELFAQARAGLPPHKVVGITGTNGKSTTTALVYHILETAGVPAAMGGNIGLPILAQEPLTPNDSGVGVYVLELSSYQIDLTFSLDCDVAVLLNVTPDHLDRYADFAAYAASKARLFAMQSDGHAAIDFTLRHSREGGNPSAALRASEEGREMDPRFRGGDENEFAQSEWPALQGPHNLQNAQAAIETCGALGLIDVQIADGLRTYPGLPHRMERVRTLNGVLFVNDSKATNADSTAPALAAYPAVRWILGGQAKTHELDACAPHFSHVRSAHTIGEAGALFAGILRPHVPVEECGTLDVAVKNAAAVAEAGDTVLLSPACASFDQFRDFEDRGDTFRRLVEAL